MEYPFIKLKYNEGGSKMLLSDYLGIGYQLDENGIFDPVLDKDSHFFINLQRLKKADISGKL